MRQVVVVIDPGHGGEIPVGGSSPTRAVGPNGLREKDVTLDLARRVRSLLSPQLRVVLTRDEDRNLSLTRRAGIARENGAEVFLSLHFDGAPDPLIDRTQPWIARNASASTRRFAESVAAAVARAAGIAPAPPTERNLGVLVPERHGPNTKACLLEIAYLTNRSQASRLERDSYRQDLASAIAGAVQAHLGESTAGALDTPVVDEAFDNKRAMLYPKKAPLNVDDSKDIPAEDRAVWTYCPTGFNIDAPEVLVFFHGNHHYVGAKLVGGAIKSKPPSWAPPVSDDNSGIIYGFDKVDGLLHQPIELLPEVGVPNLSSKVHWSVPNAGRLVNKDGLGELIDECLDRLSKLAKPSGRVKYLSKNIKTKDLKRLFMMAHSGGMVPLAACARSNAVFSVPTDLVEFDSTFGKEDVTPYFDFCKTWDGKGLLGNGEKSSRFMTFYGSGTPYMGPPGKKLERGGDTLLHTLTATVKSGGLGFTCNTEPILVPPAAKKGSPPPVIDWPDKDVIYIKHQTDNKDEDKPPSSANLDGIREALKRKYKAVFVYTNVGHEGIPLTFMPLILEYKRNP